MKSHMSFIQLKVRKKMGITKAQENAMNARGGNYLVSASAGSGKTFVLTERVFNVILEGAKLDELLILTFTNLAAAEMRDRIRDKLIKLGDEKSLKIAASLDAANIQTYDAFALNIVKKYGYAINMNKDISLVDATLLELEERKIIEKIFLEKYEASDERFFNLIDDYCLKNSDNLKDFIIDVYHKFLLQENKDEYIANYISIFYQKDRIKKDVLNYVDEIKSRISKLQKIVNKFENIEYVNIVSAIFERVINASTYEEFYFELKENEANAFPRASGATSLKDCPFALENYKVVKAEFDKYKEMFNFSSLGEIINQYFGVKDHVEVILDIVKELDKKINEFKARYNVYSFNDIFNFATQIISIPDINKEIKNKFKYIMIDEYQDTSDVQEKFINKIANNNVYVVGDVKQSIYRFRNANCDIFLSKFDKYGKGIDGTRIELPDNFRSRKEVVDAVNQIFSPLMNKGDTGLDYQNEHLMIHGNKSYLESNENYSAEILDYELGEKYLANEHEARLIATDIAKKINDKFQVYDKDLKSLRDIEYKDFAIILATKTDFSLYQKIFNEYQIPLFANYNKSIRENDLTMTFENLISLLYLYSIGDTSSIKFRHAFISVIRSFLFEIKDPKIADLVANSNYSDYEAYKLIEKTYIETKNENLKIKVSTLIKNFSIYTKLIKIGEISSNTSLLEYYYSIASQMDAMGYSLEDFKLYFDELKEFEIDPEYTPTDDVTNCVKLLSIHASKGLQFKVCYFAQLYKRFNTDSIRGKLLVDSIYGIEAPNVYNANLESFYHNLIVDKEKRELLLEQLRLFYVALTRAEEKIIILHNINDRKTPIVKFSQITHLYDFVSLSNAPFNHYQIEIENIRKVIEEKKIDIPVIDFLNAVTLSNETTINKHASKELDNDTDEELLLLGNKYHYYLELVDFNNLDTSFIKDKLDKKRIDKFLSNPLFKNMKDANVMHEYPFYDEEENVHGVIDLLVEHSDHIDIIDFKLSHVDDIAYEKQLGIYKTYISKITNKKINTFVTGILSGDIKKID